MYTYPGVTGYSGAPGCLVFLDIPVLPAIYGNPGYAYACGYTQHPPPFPCETLTLWASYTCKPYT